LFSRGCSKVGTNAHGVGMSELSEELRQNYLHFRKGVEKVRCLKNNTRDGVLTFSPKIITISKPEKVTTSEKVIGNLRTKLLDKGEFGFVSFKKEKQTK